jgi:hypothetical protein
MRKSTSGIGVGVDVCVGVNAGVRCMVCGHVYVYID